MFISEVTFRELNHLVIRLANNESSEDYYDSGGIKERIVVT
jgi:hypothetical protein